MVLRSLKLVISALGSRDTRRSTKMQAGRVHNVGRIEYGSPVAERNARPNVTPRNKGGDAASQVLEHRLRRPRRGHGERKACEFCSQTRRPRFALITTLCLPLPNSHTFPTPCVQGLCRTRVSWSAFSFPGRFVGD